MPNLLAYLAIFAYPLLALILAKKLRFEAALVAILLVGYLILPTRPEIPLPVPGLPAIGKETVPVFCALVLCLTAGGRLERQGQQAGGAARGAGTFRTRPAQVVPAQVVPAQVAAMPVSPVLSQRSGEFSSRRSLRAAPTTRGARKESAESEGSAGAVEPEGREKIVAEMAARSSARRAQGLRNLLIPALLLLALLIAPLITAMTNTDPRPVGGGRVLPPLRLYDAGSMISGQLVALLPFLFARRFLATPEAHRRLLQVFVLCGLAYTIPMLWEMRMSPQLSADIYGFFPHSFLQHIRGGHYRPVVFLHHGLWLGILMAAIVLAAATLWRSRDGAHPQRWLWACAWLLAILVMSRNLGALMLTLAFLPLLLLTGRRLQMTVIAGLAIVVLLYPALRGAGLIPLSAITDMAFAINPARAQSLEFRLNNEDQLLELANLKPLGGWGSWGRNLVYNEYGRQLSVVDGTWIILAGTRGWLGYLATFGLLGLPLVLLALRGRRQPVALATLGLAFMLTASFIDLIPNGTLTGITWLMAGAIAGYWERGLGESTQEAQPDAPAAGRRAAVRRGPAPARAPAGIPAGGLAMRGAGRLPGRR